MRGVNKVILLGNLGQDPEKRETPSGLVITNLSIATTEAWKDKQSGEKKEETTWHKVVLFGRLGEIADQYLSKGSQVYIEGRISVRKWQDKEGNDRWSTEIVASEIQLLGGKGGDRPQSNSHQPAPDSRQPQPGGGIQDDEVPFAPHEAGRIA